MIAMKISRLYLDYNAKKISLATSKRCYIEHLPGSGYRLMHVIALPSMVEDFFMSGFICKKDLFYLMESFLFSLDTEKALTKGKDYHISICVRE